MPEIARFRGIIITMYYADPARHPVAHFHARSGEHQASFMIEPPAWLAGTMPRRQMQIILGWAELHSAELIENWRRLQTGEILHKIEGVRQGEAMSVDLDVYYSVTDFEIVGPHRLRLLFDDGTAQVIDFAPVLYGPVFEPLRDLELFNQVQLNQDTGTIEWPTGADFSPVVLHDWPHYKDKLIGQLREGHAVVA
jgi:hypothetical protein